MQYEVTIGIPVYRAVNYIEKTMESALSQSYPNIEFLILDDCGKDGSMDVVERLQKEHPRGKDIRILRHDKNYGIGIARNRILDEAQGKYLFFLDSDDIINNDTIQILIDEVQKIDADIVYGSWDRIDIIDKTPPVQSIYPYMQFTKDDELAMYAFKNYSSFRISVCNCLMNLKFIRSHNLRFIDAIFWEDMAFTYELVTKVRRAVLLAKITYHYLCRSNSLSHYQIRELLTKSEIMDNVMVLDYLKNKSKQFKNKTYLSYYCYNLEMNSFYTVCYILKYYQRIVPKPSYDEMTRILAHPIGIWEISQFRDKLFHNLFFWLLGHLPSSCSIIIVRLIGKIKKAI